jgi:hypothetical protein
MYPSPNSISVQETMDVTLLGNSFIRMETTDVQQAASHMPVKNLEVVSLINSIFTEFVKFEVIN